MMRDISVRHGQHCAFTMSTEPAQQTCKAECYLNIVSLVWKLNRDASQYILWHRFEHFQLQALLSFELVSSVSSSREA